MTTITLPQRINVEADQFRPGLLCLIEDTWCVINGNYYELKTGFYFDGMSMPRFLWSIMGHPFSIDMIIQVLWHDVFFGTHFFEQSKCDELLELMSVQRNLDWEEHKIDCRISWTKRKLIHAGLRTFGWIAYKRKTIEQIIGCSKHLFINDKQFNPSIIPIGA